MQCSNPGQTLKRVLSWMYFTFYSPKAVTAAVVITVV